MSLSQNGVIKRQLRFRTVLLWLMMACLIPVVVGACVLISHEYQRRREQLEQNTIAMARAMVRAVDNRLAISMTAVQGLAAHGIPDKKDFQQYYPLAKSQLQATGAGMNFVLSDEAGQQLINTLKLIDEPLPRHGNLDHLARAFSSGKPVISDIYMGGILKKPVLSIDVPMLKGGKPVYVLSIGLLPSDFNSILEGQKLPKNWVASIFDSKGTIVARTHAAHEFVGQKGSDELIEKIANSPEGVINSVTREGIPVLSAWSRSATTGWSVGIGIPRELLNRELNTTMGWLAGGILFILSLSLVLTAFYSRKIANLVRELTIPARAMIAGEEVKIPRLNILEFSEIAEDIRLATSLLRERALALEVANRDLDRLAHIDTLTGLQNRLSMDDAIRICYARYARTQRPYAVLFIDIDFFKRINDTYGHEHGDHVLREVAQLLQASLRETDLLARYGGEEFLAILPDSGRDEMMTVAEKIRLSVVQHAFPVPDQVTISIGATLVAVDDKRGEDAVLRADLALYEAKDSGRNQVCYAYGSR